MLTEVKWLKKRLSMERRHSKGLFQLLKSANEGLRRMLQQKDELEAELQRNRAECEELHSKLIKAGLK